MGVRVTPYINGRIFDMDTESWIANDGQAQKAAAKQTSNIMNATAEDLSYYEESYGSQAKFAVMCPHTNYWQNKIISVVDKIVNTYHTDGVYIDQIASAGPRPCYDRTHNHSLGGGDHWVKGYNTML
jgi:hypothetical protein